MPSQTPYRIELLGHFCVWAGERAITRFSTQKTAALLAFLAYHPGRSHSRSSLVEMLWPGGDPEVGRNRLSTALWSIRREMAEPSGRSLRLLHTTRDAVGIAGDAVGTDVAAFEATLRRAHGARSPVERLQYLGEAVQQYSAPLLPDFHEAWVLTERQRLEEAFFTAVQRLICHLEESGDHQSALTYATRAVRIDPLREEVTHALMRLHVALDQPAAALRAYRELEQALREELDTAPTETLRRLARQLSAPRQPVERSEPVPTAPPAPARADTSRRDRPERTQADHLPQPLTRFFGREDEVTRLCLLLRGLADERPRLVTLTGPAGSGKTRLAMEVALALAGPLEGSVWFVPLADISSTRLLETALLRALRETDTPELSPLEQVVDLLRRSRALLVLDNFEQLIPAGLPVLRNLLERAPLLRCLITSRHQLNLCGEHVLPVLPLPVPGEADENLDSLTRTPSVRLLLDRARAVRPGFEVTEGNAASIAALCRRLEGLPLAIELAAARLATWTPEQLLAGLVSRLDLPASHRPDAVARHRTLRAALEWDYHLIPRGLRRFFACLSIFLGGWTADAAAAVCEEPRAPVYLRRLHECSLISTEEPPRVPQSVIPEVRFRMLEVLREFAQGKLRSSEQEALARRHAVHFLAMVEQAEFQTSERISWQHRLALEQGNLRAALSWLLSHDPGLALRLATAIAPFWRIWGYFLEGQDALGAALAGADDAPAELRALALQRAGSLALSSGEYALAGERLSTALTLAHELGDHRRTAEVLHLAGWVARFQGEYTAAETFIGEALALARALNDESAIASTLNLQAACLGDRGETEAARACLDESLDLYRRRGGRGGVAACLHDLGILAYREGDDAGAHAFFIESLALRREDDIPTAVRFVLTHLGHVLCRQGDLVTARAHLTEALTLCRRIYDRRMAARCLEGFAALAAAEGDPRRAVRLFATAISLRKAIGFVRAPADRPEIDRQLAALRQTLGDTPFTAAWEAGRALPWQHAAEEALR